jgi:hypothetical protein
LNRRVDLALIDFDDPHLFGSFYKRDAYKRIREFLDFQQFSVQDVVGNMVLFGRGGKDQKTLYRVLSDPPVIINPLDVKFDNSLRLGGYEIRLKGDYLELVFYWQVLETPTYDLSVFIEFKDPAGAFKVTNVSPFCYRIYPTQAWKKSTWVADYKYLLIPSVARKRNFDVFIGFAKTDVREPLPYIKLNGYKGEPR